ASRADPIAHAVAKPPSLRPAARPARDAPKNFCPGFRRGAVRSARTSPVSEPGAEPRELWMRELDPATMYFLLERLARRGSAGEVPARQVPGCRWILEDQDFAR